jgi:hypothetical protein
MRNKAKTWGVIGTSKNRVDIVARGSSLGAAYLLSKIHISNPNCRPYSSPHQVPKHKMLWHIE